MYQNISRRYRPQTFKDIVGQEHIVTTLKNAIRLNKLAPVYLFSGCRGTGKTTFARLLAKAINCEQLTQDQEPCNQCFSCSECLNGKSLDILELDGASNRGIDDIRQINETIYYASAKYKYKIYIIDEVHMLTKEAFNALLKTLEEAPNHVKFFFATTEPHKILLTILSRCQRFDLQRLTTKQMITKLQQIAKDLNIEVEDTCLEWISQMSEGSLRDAESLLDQLLCYAENRLTLNKTLEILGIPPRHLYFQLDKAVENTDLSVAFNLAKDVFSSGKEFSVFLDGLIDHYRTILSLKLSIPPFSSLQPSEQKHYQSALKIYTQDECLEILNFLVSWYKEIFKLPFKQVSLEMILLHLIQTKKRISIPTLIRRLEMLETSYPDNPKNEPPLYSSHLCKTSEEEIKESGAFSTGLSTDFKNPASIKEDSIPKAVESSDSCLLSKPISASPVGQTEATAQPKKVDILEQKKNHPNRTEIIMRFAAVELEGIIKKE